MRLHVGASRVLMLVLAMLCVASMLVGCEPKVPAALYSQRPAAPPATTPTDEPAGAPAGPWVKVFEVGNVYGVHAGATVPTFQLDKPATLVDLMTYHYIAGGGPAPGALGLKGADGKTYGPWSCTGIDAQGGVKNGFWDARPNVQLPAGTYTIVDSDPGTWSTNSRAQGVGFCTVQVVYDK